MLRLHALRLASCATELGVSIVLPVVQVMVLHVAYRHLLVAAGLQVSRWLWHACLDMPAAGWHVEVCLQPPADACCNVCMSISCNACCPWLQLPTSATTVLTCLPIPCACPRPLTPR
jgi:hypothetical protein